VKLAEDPAQLLVNFASADRPEDRRAVSGLARGQLSEPRQHRTVSLFLDRSEGLQRGGAGADHSQSATLSGLQSWAPLLIPALFSRSHGAGVLVRNVAERLTALGGTAAIRSVKGSAEGCARRGSCSTRRCYAGSCRADHHEEVLRLLGTRSRSTRA